MRVYRRKKAGGVEVIGVDDDVHFVAQHLGCGGTQDQFDFASGLKEYLQQPHGVGSPARAGHRQYEWAGLGGP